MPYSICNNVRLYYEIIGEGPPLLLINGLSADSRRWALLVPLLKSSFTLIIFDMRGAGQSDKPKEPYTIAQIADDTYRLIKQLNYDEVDVLGFSMGGAVALDLAIHHPEVVDNLVLVSTLSSWTRPYPPPDSVNTLFHKTDISPELLAEVYDSIHGPRYKKRVMVEDFIKFKLEDTNPQPVDAYLNQLQACEKFDLCDEVKNISSPTIIITGDSDKIIPMENSRWLNENITNSKLFVFEGIGHVVPDEAPKELADCLKRRNDGKRKYK